MFNTIDNDQISMSIRNGLYIPFMYKGRQVVAHNASWSFREKIWVDDELVVNQSGYSMSSSHIIDVAGDKMTITFGSRNRMREIFLEARVGEELVHEVSHRVGKDLKPATMILYGIGFALVGMVVGYTLGKLVVSLVGVS